MKKSFIQNVITCIGIIISGATTCYSQSDTAKLNSYDELSLKDLLNVKIVSVSKTPEFLFDAALSASVVTKEQIRKTGCTSIMEALRLVPGMIVREQSNGNYDIHLRGMDNVPPNAPFDVTSNTTTLVMIDNRPVYSYLRGGTFWETLPVDLNDVEKIEVIRGPAAALYGPNAVNGVINIITSQPVKYGLYAIVNPQAGGLHTFINNASLGYKSNKWNMIVSGNYQDRKRSQTSYFEFFRNRELENPDYLINFNSDTVFNIKQRYPATGLAMKKYAGNIFFNYDASKKVKLNLSAGVQHSQVQKVSTENEITPLSEAESVSRYIDLRAKAASLTAQVSYNQGTQNTDYDPGNKYDFNILDANIEYNYLKGKFSLTPGLSYKSAVYDDTKYSNLINKTGIFNGRGIITTQSASIRSEYRMMNNKLRLTAGLAASKFNYPDATYTSYELAATYKINKQHLLRAVYSRAPRSSNIFDTYVDQSVAYFPVGYKKFVEIALKGNKNLKLLTANMFEAGYRGNLASNLTIDVEIFNIHAKNYNTLVERSPVIEFYGTDTVFETPIASTNLPLQLIQQGITASLNYSSIKVQFKPFITLQYTDAKNYSPSINAPDANIPDAAQNNIYSAMGTTMKLRSTPAVFGGAQINYVLTSKLNINISAYYSSIQTYSHISNLMFMDGVRGIDHIPAKLILNSNVSYQAIKPLHIFISGKNILNDKRREFFHTDKVPVMLLAGLNYEF